MTCYRGMLRIPWTPYRTNISIMKELNIRDHERLLPITPRQILKFFGPVLRQDGIDKILIPGGVDGRETEADHL